MEHTREVRLGLVLYGGVSLAVYENGVAQELYRAIRGDGIYGLVKDLIDSDILVDIISGTSAGGVNGVMLGYALANNRDFAPVADLWRNQADIQALLRDQGDENTNSVLNSDYYQCKLEECFAQMKGAAPPPAPAPSEVTELDLFVTGTDANGSISTVFDDAGHPIDVKNHRALFKLSFRGGRTGENEKNDFKTASEVDLAKLCRLTSCFPAAFEPVRIDGTPGDGDSFFRWGKLREGAVYLDGGILNNKPFTSTIQEVSRRTANREVERFVIYVEPDPEVFAEQTAKAQPRSPNVAQAAFGALLSIPRYQSIAADLAAIEEHNVKVERVTAILDTFGGTTPLAPEALQGGVVCRFEASDAAYNGCRLIQLRDAAVEGILDDSNGRGYLANSKDRHAARLLVESFSHWEGDPAPTLRDFDVYFRLRRAQYISHVLMDHIRGGGSQKSAEAAWEQINHFFKLYEICEWAMKTALQKQEFHWKELADSNPGLDLAPENERLAILGQISKEKWGQVRRCLESLLDPAGITIPAQPGREGRGGFYRVFRRRVAPQSGNSAGGNLLQEIDRLFEAALKNLPAGPLGDMLRGEYSRFLDVDRQLFPILFGSGSESMDAIRVVRFSPRDAQRGLSNCKDVSEKVAGGTLAAFGGFFKKTWRANDIMVGRLDAACQLLECLVTRVRLAQVGKRPPFTAPSLEQYFRDLRPEKLQELKLDKLATLLNSYLKDPASATEQQWNDLVDGLTSVAHQVIASEEWPKVIQCAIEQEHQWGQYQLKEKAPDHPYDSSNLKWIRAKRRPDQVLVAVAAKAFQMGIVPEFTQGRIAGHPFGEEIPEPVLTELALLGTMRASKSLVASAPSDTVRRKIEGNPLQVWVASGIIPALYRWTRMRRTRPDFVIVMNTILPVAGLTTLLLGVILAFHPFGWTVPANVWGVLIGAPIVLFGLWWFLLRKLL